MATRDESGILCFISRRCLTACGSFNATPRSLLQLERNTEFLDTSLDDVYLPCSDSRAIPSSPFKLEWKIGLPGPTHEEDCIPRRNSRIPPQLEKRYLVPPSSQDEALAPYSVSREVPRSVLKCETVLAPLMRPQKFLDTLV